MNYTITIISVLVALLLGSGFRIIRPTQKGLVETFGKYTRTAEQGLQWIIPFVQRMIKVNITERMVDVDPQIVQTGDKLNTEVDAIVYYQIKDVKASQYNVDDHQAQLTKLAKTTLRAVIGNMFLEECIQNRTKINTDVERVLDKETDSYGVNVLRVEVQRIEPPKDVQEAMNKVVKATQAKLAAKDFATATETEADGERRAAIKKAEGIAKGKTIVADANAYKIRVENQSASKYFVGNAQKLKNLETTQASLENNSKVVLTEKGISPNIILGEIPIKQK